MARKYLELEDSGDSDRYGGENELRRMRDSSPAISTTPSQARVRWHTDTRHLLPKLVVSEAVVPVVELGWHIIIAVGPPRCV